MLHKYCGGHSNGCSCGFLHGACGGGASYSIPFQANKPGLEEHGGYLSPPSTVDCTLSLGTPSTRQTSNKPSPAPMPTICLNIISESGKRAPHGTGDESYFTNIGGDPLLLARRCANCDTTSTPLWRNGPRGPKSLCNACGIRYKKEERRAAAASPSRSSSSSSMAGAAARGAQHAWSCYDPPAAGAFNENQEAAYLPWRLNIVHAAAQFPFREGPSLFRYQ